jgi:hypothetical protein
MRPRHRLARSAGMCRRDGGATVSMNVRDLDVTVSADKSALIFSTGYHPSLDKLLKCLRIRFHPSPPVPQSWGRKFVKSLGCSVKKDVREKATRGNTNLVKETIHGRKPKCQREESECKKIKKIQSYTCNTLIMKEHYKRT